MTLLFAFAFTGAAHVDVTSAPSPVAVVHFAPITNDEYAVAPKTTELNSLAAQVRNAMAASELHLRILPMVKMDNAPCANSDCARRIGKELGARTVVYGTVARLTGIRWTAQVFAVDVRSGRIVDELTYGVFGDYESLYGGIHEVGTCLARSLSGRPHCAENPPTV